MKRNPLEGKYQQVILTLTDGREIRATVPAFADDANPVSVRTIGMTEPKDLPPGYSWEEMTPIHGGDAAPESKKKSPKKKT